jgi:hypothetical protein
MLYRIIRYRACSLTSSLFLVSLLLVHTVCFAKNPTTPKKNRLKTETSDDSVNNMLRLLSMMLPAGERAIVDVGDGNDRGVHADVGAVNPQDILRAIGALVQLVSPTVPPLGNPIVPADAAACASASIILRAIGALVQLAPLCTNESRPSRTEPPRLASSTEQPVVAIICMHAMGQDEVSVLTDESGECQSKEEECQSEEEECQSPSEMPILYQDSGCGPNA